MPVFSGLAISLVLTSACVAQTPSPTPAPVPAPARATSYVAATRGVIDDDKSYAPHIEKPAYEKEGPPVLLDEAHRNLPLNLGLVRLLTADGYRIEHAKSAFTYEGLSQAKVLVIVNPGMLRSRQSLDHPEPLFTEAESAAIHDWVAGGGALLIAFNSMTSDVTAVLRRFQVEFNSDFVFDEGLRDPGADPHGPMNSKVFSGDTQLLSTHKVIAGRAESERVRKIALGGVSVVQQAPENASPLLRCSEKATLLQRDALQMKELEAATAPGQANPPRDFKSSVSPARAPVRAAHAPAAIAFTLGKGRVVMVSNGMFLSALVSQIALNGQSATQRTGLAEADNQQFTLNIMHWLSGLID